MKYDFTSIMDRHGKDAIAVDGLGTGFAPAAPKEGFDAIPMWVADMNFPTVPTIQEAIIERTNHPAFGYFNPTDEYFDSIIWWQAKRNGVQGLTKECIGYENGVLGGVILVGDLGLLGALLFVIGTEEGVVQGKVDDQDKGEHHKGERLEAQPHDGANGAGAGPWQGVQ